MKKLLCLLIFFCLSCNESPKSKSYCVKKVSYVDQRRSLIPSIIQIEIKDSERFILKNIVEGKLTNVFLYSLKKEDRNYFRYIDEMKIKGKPNFEKETIILKLITGYFDGEIGHKWTKSEIEKVLKSDIGLVIGKDTLRLKKCILKGNRQQPLQRIWAFGLMEKWSCIWDDLANPKIGLNLVPNPL